MRLGIFGLVLASALLGCGGVHYAININSAGARLEEAKAVGAEQLAPYEYYYAKEHLQQAQIEATEASYSDAATLAQEAEVYANKAIELAQSARRQRP
jgi:2,4-dienoyl-CoA reductase-like NADH-dependent reductase (Old Yellow Enzyme family)